MSNVQWFYADAQQQQKGPVTFDQIQQLAASGQIQPATLIWNEGMANWTAADQVQGVFNAGAAAAPAMNPYATPAAGNPMATPAGGSYPIPPVKKCSFALFLILFLLGMAVYIGGIAMFFVQAQNAAVIYETQVENLETREDAERFIQSQDEIVELEAPSLAGLGIMFLGLGILLLASIVNLIHLQRAWTLVQPGGARTTPGKGAWFNLIPLFNLYWMFVGFYGWSQDWNRIQKSHANLAHMPSAPQGIFLALPICVIGSIVPLIGIITALVAPILYIIVAANISKVVNAMADAQQGQ